MSLRKNIISLSNRYSKGKPLPKHILTRSINALKKKLDVLESMCPNSHIHRWDDELKNNPKYFFQCYSPTYKLDDIEALLCRQIEMEWHYKKSLGLLQTSKLYDNANNPIDCIQEERKLVFDNPLNPGVFLESWGYIDSQSVPHGANPYVHSYTKHLYSSKTKNSESLYLKGSNPPKLENLALTKGYGFIKSTVQSTCRAYFFVKFDKDIGTEVISKGKGSPTNTPYLKVQVDKSPRPPRYGKSGNLNKQGYKVVMHGYPISKQELYSDFPVGAKDVDANPVNVV
ncbi:hypothetical protein KW537_21395 [Vibrio fluvialis]|nr:hypothetical protein [Vibrio fluvialis]MBY8292832.1 hypothetical protein [Vibrio fluvialis]